MGAKDVRAGGAYVEVSTKDKTAGGLTAISRKLTSWRNSIAKVGGMAVSAASGAAVASVFRAVNQGSEVKDMADRTGLSTDAVQELGYAAGQTATDLAELEGGLKLMQKNVSTGGDSLKKIFGAMGMDIEEIKRLGPDEQFMRIAQAMSEVQDPALRVQYAMAIFGRSGQSLIPLLNEGAAGIERMRARARELGLVMSNEAVIAAEEMGDRLAEARAQLDAVSSRIGVAFLPALTTLLELLAEAAPALNDFARSIKEISDGAGQIRPKVAQGAAGWIESIGDTLGIDSLKQQGQFWGMMARGAARVEADDLEEKRKAKQAAAEENKARARQKLQQTGSQIKDIKSFGSFDKRDLMSGVFRDEQKKQTELLGDIHQAIVANGGRRFELPAV